MKYITFLGAAGTVTGSSYFLHATTGKGILVDMGMFQGSHQIDAYNDESIPLSPEEIDAVFLTHAHLDHSGRLPLLHRFGYHGPVYMTEATRSLTQLTLLDAVHVAREHRKGLLLYTEEDVAWILSKAVIVPYNQVVETEKFSVVFRDAGHILGSAFLEVYCKDTKDTVRRIVFSGDIGNYPEDLVKPTEWAQEADVVLLESTYGDREHTQEDPKSVLGEEIGAIEQSHGVLLIPAFSVERSQELLHLIDHLKKNHVVQEKTPVYLDSTLAVHVTHVYQHYRTLYGQELLEHARADDPFDFPGLTMVEKPSLSRQIAALPGPKVIIAGSGMMNGGRILRHAQAELPKETTRLLFVGFQAEGTLGREILEGARVVTIDHQSVPIRCHIRKSSGMSSHADQRKLLTWLSHIQGVSTVCLVHGEDPQRQALADKIKGLPHSPRVDLPMKGNTIALGEDAHSFSAYGVSRPTRNTPSKMEYGTIPT